MDKVCVKECVITRLTLRGMGKKGSPHRRVIEVWDVQTGEKIAEWDIHFRYSIADDEYKGIEE